MFSACCLFSNFQRWCEARTTRPRSTPDLCRVRVCRAQVSSALWTMVFPRSPPVIGFSLGLRNAKWSSLLDLRALGDVLLDHSSQ